MTGNATHSVSLTVQTKDPADWQQVFNQFSRLAVTIEDHLQVSVSSVLLQEEETDVLTAEKEWDPAETLEIAHIIYNCGLSLAKANEIINALLRAGFRFAKRTDLNY